MPELERYVFDAQQRKEIQDRARWSFIEHRHNVAPPGAFCGPVTNFLTGERAPCPSHVPVEWEECYDIPGSPYYLRLAHEVHPLPRGPCLSHRLPSGPVEHMNITIGLKGTWPNDFNCNAPGRIIPFDAHIAVWEMDGQICFSFSYTWRGPNGTGPRDDKCVFSSCGKPPSPPFLPWTVERAREYFEEVLQWIKSWLAPFNVNPRIVEGIIRTIANVILVCIVAAVLIAGAFLLLPAL